MARRTRNGATDPYITRRTGGSQRKAHRQSVVPLQAAKAGLKDDAGTSRALSEIGRESRDKEYSIASAGGPHSIPAQHYEKSFRIPVKKEEE